MPGHTSDLGHIHLSEKTRLLVAGQLHQGVSFQHILDEIRDSSGRELKRIHLITRKDLHNIERSVLGKSVREKKQTQYYYKKDKDSHKPMTLII